VKKRIFAAFLFCIFFCSACSMMLQKEARSIEGTWTAVHESGANVVIEFNRDNSMVFTVKGYPEFSFKADYKVDFSTEPISVDFVHMVPSGNFGNACLAIIQYSAENEMNIAMKFGTSGKIERPAKFEEYPQPPEYYLELKKSTD